MDGKVYVYLSLVTDNDFADHFEYEGVFSSMENAVAAAKKNIGKPVICREALQFDKQKKVDIYKLNCDLIATIYEQELDKIGSNG